MSLTPKEKREHLSWVPLFADLSPSDLDSLVPLAQSRAMRKREELFHKGDEAAQVYVVVEGTLEVLTTGPDGNDVVFSILGPGEVIGEIALLAADVRTATVRAIDACELLVIDRRDFFACLRNHPEVAIQLLRVLARRVTNLSELVELTQFQNLPVRLAKKMLAIARKHGEATPEGWRITLKLPQEKWGDLVGATRESINKQMRIWVRNTIISLDHGLVTILDREALESLANEAD